MAVRAAADAMPRPTSSRHDDNLDRPFETAGTVPLQVALEVEAMSETADGSSSFLGLLEVDGRVPRDVRALRGKRRSDGCSDAGCRDEHAGEHDRDRPPAQDVASPQIFDAGREDKREEYRDDDVEDESADSVQERQSGGGSDDEPDRREDDPDGDPPPHVRPTVPDAGANRLDTRRSRGATTLQPAAYIRPVEIGRAHV